MEWNFGVLGWMVWPILLVGMMRFIGAGGRAGRHHRHNRWGIDRGRWARDDQSEFDAGPDPKALLRELDTQRAELADMASRLSELENRADFTERLLAAPREKGTFAP